MNEIDQFAQKINTDNHSTHWTFWCNVETPLCFEYQTDRNSAN